jgi:hypothetical protein
MIRNNMKKQNKRDLQKWYSYNNEQKYPEKNYQKKK